MASGTFVEEGYAHGWMTTLAPCITVESHKGQALPIPIKPHDDFSLDEHRKLCNPCLCHFTLSLGATEAERHYTDTEEARCAIEMQPVANHARYPFPLTQSDDKHSHMIGQQCTQTLFLFMSIGLLSACSWPSPWKRTSTSCCF